MNDDATIAFCVGDNFCYVVVERRFLFLAGTFKLYNKFRCKVLSTSVFSMYSFIYLPGPSPSYVKSLMNNVSSSTAYTFPD